MNNLLQGAINGNKDDFIKLISPMEKQLYYIAKSRLNNEDDINDVIQETILACYQNLAKINDETKFKNWVITILINNCNDLFRKNRKAVIFSYNQNDMDVNENLVNFNNYDEINSNIDFNFLLNLLEEEEKLIFSLFYCSCITTKEISKITHINENSIKSKLKRSREKIKNFLERSTENEI